MQKFIIISANDQMTVEKLLTDGWQIKSVTALHVATGSSYHLDGKLAIVLEKVVE